MKKTTILIALLFCSFSSVFSQQEVKYKKIFYNNSTIETNEATITVDNAISTDNETKFKLIITNKTNHYLIYKPEESKFIIDSKELKPKTNKWELVAPNDYGTLVVGLNGAGYKTINNYSFLMDGLYTVAISDTGTSAPDFKLPASQNDFKAGGFSVNLSDISKETDKTSVKFKCTYNGNKIGILFPSKATVKMPDGNEYANIKSKAKPVILNNGENESFTLTWKEMQPNNKSMDMQFVEMYIRWHATYAEVTPEKLKAETLQLTFDEATSNEKGR